MQLLFQAQSGPHVPSRQLRVILLDCLDSFHGKLDEGSRAEAEGSGDVTGCKGLKRQLG